MVIGFNSSAATTLRQKKRNPQRKKTIKKEERKNQHNTNPTTTPKIKKKEETNDLKAGVKCRSQKHVLIPQYKVTLNPLVLRFQSPRGIKPNREQLTLSRPASLL